jgi:hypothetical protein
MDCRRLDPDGLVVEVPRSWLHEAHDHTPGIYKRFDNHGF